MPKEIKIVLKELDDILLKDLPPRLPPIRVRNAIKIDPEDDTPLAHQSIHRLSPLELEEAQKHIKYMLDCGSIQPLVHPIELLSSSP